MRRILPIAIALSLIASSGWAFVGRLHPNQPTGITTIPCEALGAALRAFVAGKYTAGQIGSKIESELLCGDDKVCGAGEGWTAADGDDNTALISLIGAAAVADRPALVSWIEDACKLWEIGFTDFDSPAEFRTQIGLPPNP